MQLSHFFALFAVLPVLACDGGGAVLLDDSGLADGSGEDGGGEGGGEEGGDVGGDESGGDEGGDEGGGEEGVDAGGSDEAQDYSEGGPQDVSTESKSADVGGGCTIEATRYVPEDPLLDVVVVLSHGFARSAANMQDHGEHLASWGLETLVVDLCHASIWDTDHAQNGADLAAFTDSLGYNGVIYMGQSAGGLASLVAASLDADTMAMVGLDGVDSDDIGLDLLGGVSAPLYGLLGEPSSCNASGNGSAWYSGASSAEALRVGEADHCDFEAPTDVLCTAVCWGSNDDFSDEEIRATVRGLMTAAALDVAGETAAGDGWWRGGGTYYESLVSSGAVSDL